jgi:two-component system sensor histidine kinase RegB
LEVTIAAEWSADTVKITISDDGPGFAPEVIDQLGEPYLTTRGNRLTAKRNIEHGGLGLGIFIAKTLLERSGAKLRLANRKTPQSGAVATVEWPRILFEVSATATLANSALAPSKSLIGGA